MSEDTIKRSDAIKALCKLGHEVVVIDKVCSLGVATEFIDAIRAIPSADRPQGEWEERPSEDWISIRRWYCSECGEWQTYGMTNYCPNCGADMRGDNDGKDIQSADE